RTALAADSVSAAGFLSRFTFGEFHGHAPAAYSTGPRAAGRSRFKTGLCECRVTLTFTHEAFQVPLDMRRTPTVALGTLAFVLLGLSGCDASLGKCTDKYQGRDPVSLPSGSVMYEGQAIINASCAGGRCHSSTAHGDARSGAPAGLDFDLLPVQVTGGA